MMITQVTGGESLDIEIATKVMGRKLPTQDEMAAEAEKVWKTQPNCRVFLCGFIAVERTDPVTHFRGGFMFMPQVRCYSTDPEAAMLVIEELSSRRPFLLSTGFVGSRLAYIASFGTSARACEYTFPMAVCRAALLCVESG